MLLAEFSLDTWTAAVLVWLAAVGGVIGSFLNVVVYRVPAGLSVVRPPSHCPACKHPIRWHDNLPVLGWMILGARCRDCGARIPARYPAVEAVVACAFVLLGTVEYLSAGANLPPRPVHAHGGSLLIDMTTREAAAVYVYHLVLWCTLLAAALIEYDGHSVPWRVFLPAFVWGLAAPLAWPHVHPVPAMAGLEGWRAGLLDSVAGLAAGAALGAATWTAVGPWRQRGVLAAGAATGLYLGWQAAVVLLTAAALLHGAARLGARRLPRPIAGLPATAWLVAGSLGWIAAWGRLASWWAGPR